MNRRLFALTLSATFGFLCVPALAGGKKEDKVTVTFHIEADNNDNPKMIFQAPVGGRQRIFRRLSDFTVRDIQDFAAFQANDGSYGLLITLKGNAATRLAAITATNPDRYLLAMINGRPVDAALIDKQITDGKLVIWKGTNALEIQELDKLVPRSGKGKDKDKDKKQ
ncbi:hypothetical protein KBB96_05995 [Luteolibacter ambystomatis]|uniref:Uncharacterized protein n=1 Tax=Luteolibacter ambystomatis TaxID=2824561 RepID=A0A975J1R8_9BACT|nr:hypothetical protein [Luteolibacter ambystomatis]QUE52441.1 hypothetical protein KBB96_05995 [Luteolibacter ambystomatis]